MREGPDPQSGMVSISYVMAGALAMVVFAALANLVVVQYASGVVRVALDEGVRVGSTMGSSACEARIDEMLAASLGGPFGDGVVAECRQDGRIVRATAQAVFQGYAPFVPDVVADFESSTVIERSP